jgi:hypothetical protein
MTGNTSVRSQLGSSIGRWTSRLYSSHRCRTRAGNRWSLSLKTFRLTRLPTPTVLRRFFKLWLQRVVFSRRKRIVRFHNASLELAFSSLKSYQNLVIQKVRESMPKRRNGQLHPRLVDALLQRRHGVTSYNWWADFEQLTAPGKYAIAFSQYQSVELKFNNTDDANGPSFKTIKRNWKISISVQQLYDPYCHVIIITCYCHSINNPAFIF